MNQDFESLERLVKLKMEDPKKYEEFLKVLKEVSKDMFVIVKENMSDLGLM